ncbi:MAG: LLM class flavin-dependent oxidoreductase, partial [Actinomycetota bacterium]|nr:LLM class flavin-dependent oxidoreductase [Actinomycetota bacterium]
MLFGVNVSTSTDSDPVAAARRAEELGFDWVSASDHLHGTAPTHETWTMLTWIAAATSRIRLATRVLATPYRHPPVVAKMAETLDRLSGGRLILGLGGGWSDEEFRAFGLGIRSPRDKVDGMEETLRIIRGLWSERAFSFRGRIYETEDAELEPKPEHRIPIWLGTYGPRALDVTGRLADGWIPTLELAPPERVVEMRDRVLSAAAEAGRNAADITCVYNLDVRVDERGESTPETVVGPPDAVVDQLARLAELGFPAMHFLPAGPDPDRQVVRLAEEVIPHLRGAGSSD